MINAKDYRRWKNYNCAGWKRVELEIGKTYINHMGKEFLVVQSEYDEPEEPTILISCESGWVFPTYGAVAWEDDFEIGRISWLPNSATGAHQFGCWGFDSYFIDTVKEALGCIDWMLPFCKDEKVFGEPEEPMPF